MFSSRIGVAASPLWVNVRMMLSRVQTCPDAPISWNSGSRSASRLAADARTLGSSSRLSRPTTLTTSSSNSEAMLVSIHAGSGTCPCARPPRCRLDRRRRGPTGLCATALGGFFRALHSVDATAAVATRVPTHDAARDEHLQHLDRFRREVLPRVPGPRRGLAESLLERLSQPPPAPVLVHGDVGQGHVLLADDTVSGVIDWSDAHVGDPALDLAWLIHGSCAGQSVATQYDADAALLQRAHDWHLLGP
jgi:aminoglycoside phosphotransferase (APT) family kinase protein